MWARVAPRSQCNPEPPRYGVAGQRRAPGTCWCFWPMQARSSSTSAGNGQVCRDFSSFPPSFYPLDKMLLERRLQRTWDHRTRALLAPIPNHPEGTLPSPPAPAAPRAGFSHRPPQPGVSTPKNRAATTDGPCQRRHRRGAQRFGLRPGSQTLPGYPVPAASPRLPITQFLVRLCTSLRVSITEAVRRGGEDLKPAVYGRYLIATS